MKSKDCPYCRAVNLAKANTCRTCGQVLPKRKRKYGNKKTVVDGIEFDSGREAERYGVLKLMLAAGEITELDLQVPFVLAEAVQYEGARKTPPLRYFADFCYYKRVGDLWVYVVEDAKGVRDRPYKIKKHLMMTVHKIEVREI